MLPLALYPELIQRIAAFTPFPVLLAGPASFVLENGSVAPGALARNLGIWSCLTGVAVSWTFRRATTAMTINGG
jgi:ABC-type uncharacterized transport system permease subunit